MSKFRINRSSGVDRHRTAAHFALLLASAVAMYALFSTSIARAVEMPSLYTAQVALDPGEDDPRAAAYEAALKEVLIRMSGSALAADVELFELMFPNPAAYVVQFRSGADDTLWVSFDGKSLENMLRQSGQTVWGNDRPLTVVWLAVDWGQGEREIVAADDPLLVDDDARSIDRNRLLRERVLDVAQRRGLPVVFPLLDAEELQSVSFSDIWGGFDDRLIEASKRYEANSVLVGRIRAASSQRNDWSYYLAGEARNWTGEPEEVLSLVGDLLASEFAIGGNLLPETITLAISGIDTVNAYGAVQRILAGVNVIDSSSIVSIDGDRIQYNVVIRGGADRLARALRFSGLIEQDVVNGSLQPIDFGGGVTQPSLLEFFYNP